MKKVVVGMSGGVDSSTAAYLLKKEGYLVVGATMKLLDDLKTDLTIRDARDVCNHLGIEHVVFDMRDEFKRLIINNFIDSYKIGLTPNPCVLCNRYFKFGMFYDKALELGADFISTGHYVKVRDSKLIMGKTKDKDQSYFLYGINKKVLDKLLFPLADFASKNDVREVAREAGISVSDKKDSQEVCFVPNDDYKAFLKANSATDNVGGNIVLLNGEILSKHDGLINYTIGQRKGLGIAYSSPLYVVKLDTVTNQVIVGGSSDLYKKRFKASSLNLLVDELGENIYAKIRSRSTKDEVIVEFLSDGDIIVEFNNPQRAITPGQSVVFYNYEDVCLGGAIIDYVLD